MIQRIKVVHEERIIHRDIKPDNFMTGGNEATKNTIYIIDFGLSKKYFSNSMKKHIPYIEGKNLTGTARYASLNTHLGIEQSRRDDLESLGYMLIYFKKKLPWQGLIGTTKKEKYKKIKNKKLETSFETLCDEFPSEFLVYMNYCRELKFYQRPDYDYLRSLFKNLYKRKYYEDYSELEFK